MEATTSRTILVVDDNQSKTEVMRNHFKSRFQIVYSSQNGTNAMAMIEKYKPQIIITDIVLSDFDGFALMDRIRHIIGYRPLIIVATSMSNEVFVEKSMSMGASYFVAKPYNENQLCQRIEELIAPKSYKDFEKYSQVKDIRSYKGLDEKITNIFISLGIPAHIKGFHFLRDAVKMSIEKPEIINSITKQLYPQIAQKNSTTASKVERAIRHAIEVAWSRGRIDNINSLFGVKVYQDNEKPTNGEFIALLADKMLLDIY